MNKLFGIYGLLFIITAILSFNPLKGQFIIEQIEYDLPVSYNLIPEEKEFENQQEEAMFFLNLSLGTLKEAAISDGRETSIIKIYINKLGGVKYFFIL